MNIEVGGLYSDKGKTISFFVQSIEPYTIDRTVQKVSGIRLDNKGGSVDCIINSGSFAQMYPCVIMKPYIEPEEDK